MLGAISGDIIGSAYEWHPVKRTSFSIFVAESTFTDDTVLTVAVADSLLSGIPYAESFRKWGRRYPDAGYGGHFREWLASPSPEPYGSFGNGSAMRVSPVAYAFETLDDVMEEAERSAAPTHNHPEGVKGAQAVAAAVFLARSGRSRDVIRKFVETTFDYNLRLSLAQIREDYEFDETCQGSVPEALTAFLESESFEDTVRKAVSLGGDADTQACIAGAVAEAFYGGVPAKIAAQARQILPADLTAVLDAFSAKYATHRPREGM